MLKPTRPSTYHASNHNKITAQSPSPAAPTLTYEYYPAYAHPAHPLRNKWLKLPVSAIQTLYVPSGFTYFTIPETKFTLPAYHLLNHPVYYVDVCGLVVGCGFREDKKHAKYWTILLDDGSGEVLHALCKKATEEEEPNPRRAGGKNAAESGKLRLAGPGELIAPLVPSWKGRGWTGGEEVDMRSAEVGRVLRVKGMVREDWGKKQLHVERIFPVRTTAEEVKFWQSMCETYETVLSKPWRLSNKKLQKLKEHTFESEGRRRPENQSRKWEGNPRKRWKRGDSKDIQEGINDTEDMEEKTERRSISSKDQAPEDVRLHIPGSVPEMEQNRSEDKLQVPITVNQDSSKTKPGSNVASERIEDTPVNRSDGTKVGNFSQCSVPSSYVTADEKGPREQLQDESQLLVIANKRSPNRWSNLDLNTDSSNEPPPGNQQAVLRTQAESFEVKGKSQANDPLASAPVEMAVVNKGLPNEWATLDLTASIAEERRSSKVLYDGEWLKVRNEAASTNSNPIQNSPKVSSHIINKGLASEWDTFGIGASLAEHRNSRVLSDAEWLRVEMGRPSSRPSHSECSRAPNSSFQGSPPLNRGELAASAYNWQDEWERIEL